MKNVYKHQISLFIIMFILAMFLNPMNILAYSYNHLIISYTQIYASFYMAFNMIWAHQIVHWLNMGHFNLYVFIFGIIGSLIMIYFLRNQLFVDDTQWLKRMIPHHSTALTTSNIIKNRSNEPEIQQLAHDIIEVQEREITLMKNMLDK